MSKLSIGQKAVRTATLLAGLRDVRIAPHLKPFGLSDQDIEEGWALFMRATGHRLNRVATSPRRPAIEKELDAFEDAWFAIVRTTLSRRFPKLGETLFLNLQRADGKDATWTVAFFLERLEAMERGEAPYGADGKAARSLLATRGLTADVVQAAQVLVDETRALSDEAPLPEAGDPTAEEEMWKWYLEWSAVTRKVIKDGNLLRLMGFKKRKAGRDAEGEVEVVEETPVQPGTMPALPPASSAKSSAAE